MDNLLISYVPLLYPTQPNKLNHHGQEAVGLIQKANELVRSGVGKVDGCVWFQTEKGAIGAILVVDRAREIADHLQYWSEGKPGKFFKFHITDCGEYYYAALSPDILRSADRRLANEALVQGFTIESPKKIIFQPLLFISDNRGSLGKVQSRLADPIEVQLADKSTIEGLQQGLQVETISIGLFPLVTQDSEIEGFVRSVREQGDSSGS